MGKGETEAEIFLCAVEGKKIPDFLSSVLYPSPHPTVQHLELYSCHLCCCCGTVMQGVITDNSPKNPFWQLLWHQDSPQLPLSKTTHPLTANIHFPELEGEEEAVPG